MANNINFIVIHLSVMDSRSIPEAINMSSLKFVLTRLQNEQVERSIAVCKLPVLPTGLRIGDTIASVNNNTVQYMNASQFSQFLRDEGARHTLTVDVVSQQRPETPVRYAPETPPDTVSPSRVRSIDRSMFAWVLQSSHSQDRKRPMFNPNRSAQE